MHSRAGTVVLLALLGAARLVSARPAVIELYTSEGCSSCPPADALLETLSHRSDVVAIAFHVDYWDSGGWRDRFALPDSTTRQQGFAKALKLSSVGTPQMIVEGRRSIAGTNPGAVERALAELRAEIAVGASLTGGTLIIEALPRPDSETYDVYAISYLDEVVTNVARGENAGRTLSEVNVVRSIRHVGAASAKGRQWKIPARSFPRDATHVLVLSQRAAQGAVVGAVVVDLR